MTRYAILGWIIAVDFNVEFQNLLIVVFIEGSYSLIPIFETFQETSQFLSSLS